jgi:FtsZ-binding cell division protein ZapB
MTKASEIELLKRLIAETPEDSYLRGLLEHLLPQFEQDIRSDFLTFVDLREMQRQADLLKDEMQKARETVMECEKRQHELEAGNRRLQNIDQQFREKVRALCLQAKELVK